MPLSSDAAAAAHRGRAACHGRGRYGWRATRQWLLYVVEASPDMLLQTQDARPRHTARYHSLAIYWLVYISNVLNVLVPQLTKMHFASAAVCFRICTYKNEAKCGPLEPKQKEEVVIKVKSCDLQTCQLPYCYCSPNGDVSPELNRRPADSPQMVMLTFDGAVNLNNFGLYDALLKLKSSFGDCPVRGTFFVKNDYNNYAMIEELYYRGNEIGVNSVTGRNLQYENLTIWREELESMRDLLGSLANIPAKDILGVRAPSLKVGFNDQYQVGYSLLYLDLTISALFKGFV